MHNQYENFYMSMEPVNFKKAFEGIVFLHVSIKFLDDNSELIKVTSRPKVPWL